MKSTLMEMTFLRDFMMWERVKVCERSEVLGRRAGVGRGLEQDGEHFWFVISIGKMDL